MLQQITNGVLRLAAHALDRPLRPPTGDERDVVEALRGELRALPTMPVAGVPGSEASWNRNLNELRELALRDDPRGFLRWPMVQRTMFATYAPYVLRELAHLRAQPDWASRWRGALRESPAWHPLRLGFYPASSGNLAHHAYHVARFEALTGQRASEMDVVFEFGGGYGSMARLFHGLGFRGRYVVFDLPHFSALQRFFLRQVGVALREADEPGPGVACVSAPGALDAALGSVAPGARSLFLATWSLSETPVTLRAGLLSRVAGFANYWLAFQHRFEEVDNVAFFERWREGVSEVAWRVEEIPQLPHNSYLAGRRRG